MFPKLFSPASAGSLNIIMAATRRHDDIF